MEMAAHVTTQLGASRRYMRLLYQRWFTQLPCRLRRFDELFPSHCDYASGIFLQRPRHTGVLLRESGQPFLITSTHYLAGKGSDLASENSSYWTREPDRIVYAMADAGIYGAHGCVYDQPSRTFITETCESWGHPFTRDLSLASPGFPQATHLPGISLMLGTLGGQTFYHFFIETLPKLRVLEPFLASCDRILVTRYGETWKRRWLSLWGLENKIVFIDELSHFTCEQLIFTNRFVRHFEPGPWCVDTLRNLPGLPSAPASVDPQGPVLWLDRTSQHMRPVSWEKELIAALPAGITPINLETLPAAEAVRLLGSARALIGFHGAAFANMVFCPPGTRIIEIFTELKQPWYARLSQTAGHDHAAVVVDDNPTGIPALVRLLADTLSASRS
jgi:hypothetical protein